MQAFTRLGLLFLLMVGLGTPVGAQDPDSILPPLGDLIGPGESVRITDWHGRTLEGRVERVATSVLVVTISRCRSRSQRAVGGWQPLNAPAEECPREATVRLRDVVSISRAYRDGLWNGALIGFGSMWALNLATLWTQDFDGDGGAWLGFWMKESLVGAGAGALLDALGGGWQEIYRGGAEGAAGGVVASPYFTRSQVGVAIQVQFSRRQH